MSGNGENPGGGGVGGAIAEHGKEAHEKNATSGGDGTAPVEHVEETATATTSTAAATPVAPAKEAAEAEEAARDRQEGDGDGDAHEQDAHQPPLEPQHRPAPAEAEEYEYVAQFPRSPEPRAPTTYDIFSDPGRFSIETILGKTHYLAADLRGTIWIDEDGDGKRGSLTDARINAIEHDAGVGGVNAQLVRCDTDEPVMTTTSLPYEGGEALVVLRTLAPSAGVYDFPLPTVGPGRYYVMYRAPRNFRLSGSVLPLNRRVTDEGAYFDCIPWGGEGDGYLEEVRRNGDLDVEGYCARSIGCIEIGTRIHLDGKYSNLAHDGSGEETDGRGSLVALPAPGALNIGLAAEEWPLRTNQRADSEIALGFPSVVTEGDLGAALPRDFETSAVKRNLETVLGELFNGADSPFVIRGVEVRGGEIVVSPWGEPPSNRGLRGSRGLEQGGTESPDYDHGKDAAESREETPEVHVKYTLTTRGSYSPPPFAQLGAIIQDSINRDPQGLVKSLRDKQGLPLASGGLPPVFGEVKSASARHLTVRAPDSKTDGFAEAFREQLSKAKADEGGDGRMARWATVPVVLLAALVSALAGTLLFRRVFTRRRKDVKRDHVRDYIEKGGGFSVSSRPKVYDDGKKRMVEQGRDYDPSLDDIVEDTTIMVPSTDCDDDTSERERRNESKRRERKRKRRREKRSATIESVNTSARSSASRSVNTQGSKSTKSGNTQGSKSTKSGSRSSGAGGSHSRSVNTQGSKSTKSGSRSSGAGGSRQHLRIHCGGTEEGKIRSHNLKNHSQDDIEASEQCTSDRGERRRKPKKKSRGQNLSQERRGNMSLS